jgi:hypothetical protein
VAWQDRAALGTCFAGTGERGPLLVVYNHLPRPVTGLASQRVHIRALHHLTAWRVRDLVTGEIVPHQTDRPLQDEVNYHQTTHRHLYDLSFLASEVPALGYRLYRLEAIDEPAMPSGCASWTAYPCEGSAGRLEWSHGTLDVDPATGAVLDWRRGERRRPLPADRLEPLLGECRLFGFTECLGRSPDFIRKNKDYRVTQVIRPSNASIAPLSAGPLWGGYRAGCVLGELAQLTLEVRVFRHCPHLEVILGLRRLATLPTEALAVAWPQALTDVDFFYDGGGIDCSVADHGPGASGDAVVADRWSACVGREGALLLASPEAPVTSLGGMHLLSQRRGLPSDLRAELWTILSLNGQWRCGNIPLANRESGRWRMVVQATDGFDADTAQAFGEAVAQPLSCELVEGSAADAPLAAPSGRLLELTTPAGEPLPAGVQLVSLTSTDDGLGIELLERSGVAREVMVGRPGEPPTRVDLAPHAVASLTLR